MRVWSFLYGNEHTPLFIYLCLCKTNHKRKSYFQVEGVLMPKIQSSPSLLRSCDIHVTNLYNRLCNLPFIQMKCFCNKLSLPL